MSRLMPTGGRTRRQAIASRNSRRNGSKVCAVGAARVVRAQSLGIGAAERVLLGRFQRFQEWAQARPGGPLHHGVPRRSADAGRLSPRYPGWRPADAAGPSIRRRPGSAARRRGWRAARPRGLAPPLCIASGATARRASPASAPPGRRPGPAATSGGGTAPRARPPIAVRRWRRSGRAWPRGGRRKAPKATPWGFASKVAPRAVPTAPRSRNRPARSGTSAPRCAPWPASRRSC